MPLNMEPLEEPTLNLTPMIDIVLLLVIFFMVGTQFTESESQFEIELPEAVAAQPLTGGPDELTIEITREGTAVLDGEPVDDTELAARMQAAAERFAGQAVIVRGDRSIDLQRAVTVMNLVERSGIRAIQLALQPQQAPPNGP